MKARPPSLGMFAALTCIFALISITGVMLYVTTGSTAGLYIGSSASAFIFIGSFFAMFLSFMLLAKGLIKKRRH